MSLYSPFQKHSVENCCICGVLVSAKTFTICVLILMDTVVPAVAFDRMPVCVCVCTFRFISRRSCACVYVCSVYAYVCVCISGIVCIYTKRWSMNVWVHVFWSVLMWNIFVIKEWKWRRISCFNNTTKKKNKKEERNTNANCKFCCKKKMKNKKRRSNIFVIFFFFSAFQFPCKWTFNEIINSKRAQTEKNKIWNQQKNRKTKTSTNSLGKLYFVPNK